MRLLGASSAALLATLTAAPAQAQNRSDAITFTKDIAPIFQEKCEVCHRAEGMAPMSLSTYSDVRPWARSIKRKVEERDMPPWYVDKTVGIQKFANDRSLSDREIDLIARWVDAGAPQGNPRDLPQGQGLADRGCVGVRRVFRPPARPHREVARLHDAAPCRRIGGGRCAARRRFPRTAGSPAPRPVRASARARWCITRPRCCSRRKPPKCATSSDRRGAARSIPSVLYPSDKVEDPATLLDPSTGRPGVL